MSDSGLTAAGSSTYSSDTLHVGDGTWDSHRDTFLLPNLMGVNFATMQYNGKSVCINPKKCSLTNVCASQVWVTDSRTWPGTIPLSLHMALLRLLSSWDSSLYPLSSFDITPDGIHFGHSSSTPGARYSRYSSQQSCLFWAGLLLVQREVSPTLTMGLVWLSTSWSFFKCCGVGLSTKWKGIKCGTVYR